MNVIPNEVRDLINEDFPYKGGGELVLQIMFHNNFHTNPNQDNAAENAGF